MLMSHITIHLTHILLRDGNCWFHTKAEILGQTILLYSGTIIYTVDHVELQGYSFYYFIKPLKQRKCQSWRSHLNTLDWIEWSYGGITAEGNCRIMKPLHSIKVLEVRHPSPSMCPGSIWSHSFPQLLSLEYDETLCKPCDLKIRHQHILREMDALEEDI